MNGLFSAFQPNPEDERKVKEAQVMMNSLQQQAQQPAAPQSTGIFGGLKNYFANPVNTANLAASMNSMVINPNDFYNQNARDVKAMQLQKMQQQQAAEQQQLQQQQAAEQQNKTVQFLTQNGRPDLADQVAGGHLPAKDAMTLMNKQVQQVSGAQLGAGYDPNINYNVKPDGSVTPIGSPVTNINNNMPNPNIGQNSFFDQVGKESGERLLNDYDLAIGARKQLFVNNDARNLLKQKIYTGIGANFQATFGAALHKLGFSASNDAATNTQAFGANAAKSVAEIIKAFGAGTGLSDADREYALKAAAGDVTMTQEALSKILDINDRASLATIERYNQIAQQVPPNISPYTQQVEIPTFETSIDDLVNKYAN